MTIRDMKVLSPIAWVFSIGGNEIVMTNTLIDARSHAGFPFNTGKRESFPVCLTAGWP